MSVFPSSKTKNDELEISRPRSRRYRGFIFILVVAILILIIQNYSQSNHYHELLQGDTVTRTHPAVNLRDVEEETTTTMTTLEIEETPESLTQTNEQDFDISIAAQEDNSESFNAVENTFTGNDEQPIPTSDSQQLFNDTTVPEDHSNRECPTLTELAHQMAEYSSPPNSPSYLKNRRILTDANNFFIESPYYIFSSVTDNINLAMSNYGLKRIQTTAASTIDSDDPANHDTILFYWSSHLKAKDDKCRGSRCKDMFRVILQTEQLNRRMVQFRECHQSPNCVIWDFSDANLRIFQEINISDSVLLVPHMFHDRLGDKLPSAFKPSKDRDIDAVLLGFISNRRKEFKAQYLVDENDPNGTIQHDYNTSLSSQNIVYKVQKKNQHRFYENAKICMVVHAHLADGACEYHRLSEISRFGCILVVENVGDTLTVDALQQCGGVHFAGYHEVAKTIHEQLAYIEETPESELKARQEKFDRWWADGVHWEGLFETIFGPRGRSNDLQIFKEKILESPSGTWKNVTNEDLLQIVSSLDEGVRNIAEGKPTQQSTTNSIYSSDSRLAVDGITEADFHDGSVTATEDGFCNSWWKVSLGSVQEISTVAIYNRKDCCEDRLNNFVLALVTPESGSNGIDGKDVFNATAQAHVLVEEERVGDVGLFTFPNGSEGSDIYIQKFDCIVLSLTEVMVFGQEM